MFPRVSNFRSWLGAGAVAVALMVSVESRAQPVTYRVEALPTGELTSRFSEGELAVLEKINRADRGHLPRLRQLVIPSRWADDERQYSPLPRRHEPAAAVPKFLVVHVPGQVFGAYQFGELVRWGPVSSGAADTATPPGRYHLTWRATGHVSTVNPGWFMPWYFNLDNEQGRAFHEYELPGQPASHGCVRLLGRDARWLFEWGDEWRLDARRTTVIEPGTAVLIVGAYEFASPPPWRSPEWLRQPIELPASITGY
jgi:hypothetical protein